MREAACHQGAVYIAHNWLNGALSLTKGEDKDHEVHDPSAVGAMKLLQQQLWTRAPPEGLCRLCDNIKKILQ